jgi:hypothetical protein
MQFVPPTHEQTPIRCSKCHERYVSFVLVHPPLINAGEYSPNQCTCGHLENAARLPPGTLFGHDEAVKSYHPLNRPN